MGMACNYFSTYFRVSCIPFGAVRAFSALHPREIQFVNADSPVSLSRVAFIAVNSKICVTDPASRDPIDEYRGLLYALARGVLSSIYRSSCDATRLASDGYSDIAIRRTRDACTTRESSLVYRHASMDFIESDREDRDASRLCASRATRTCD